MDKSILHIASAKCFADDLLQKGFQNVYAFNEAMCEGSPISDIYSTEFCMERAEAYGVTVKEYYEGYRPLHLNEIRQVELYFDYDMFCCMNAITLLACFEQLQYQGEVIYHLIEQNGTADIIETFSVTLGKYREIYEQVLISKIVIKTDYALFNKAIELYLNYKQTDNEIVKSKIRCG